MATRRRLASLVRVLKIVWRAAPIVMVSFVGMSLIGAIAPVATSWSTKLLLDRLVGRSPMSSVMVVGGVMVAAGVVTALVPQVARYYRSELDRRAGLFADDLLYVAVNGFDGIEHFEDPAFLDRLRLAQQAGRGAPGRVVDGVVSVVRGTFTVGGYLTTLFLVNPIMAVVLLLSGAPMFFAEASLARAKAATVAVVGARQRRELFYGNLLSSVSAAKEIRLFGLGSFFRSRMRTHRLAADASQRRMDKREQRAQALLSLMSAGISGAGLLWVVHAAASGRSTIGDIALFIQAVAGVQAALGGQIRDVASAHQQLLLFDHHVAVTEAPADLPRVAYSADLPALRRGIELRDVWFRYSPGHPWVLRGVNLFIPYGRSVGLVGLNGAGKSTLVKLLCRFYDPTRGSICWDGVDLRDVDPAALRARISAVFQDFMQYDLTAAENIGVGELGRFNDQERIGEAARLARIHETLASLPQGYDTLLSRIFFRHVDKSQPETGVVLSGGQWQRIALARSFFREARDLLILDEPSSGLDAEAEYEIHRMLQTLRQGRTSLLISHRMAALRDADQIVVLDGGSVVEEGSHTELLALNGRYAKLFNLQARGYQESVRPPAPTGR